jgi:asparagine synthase (glutamine-hydrolysing)
MVETAQRLLLRPGERVARSGDQMHKLAAVLTASSEGTMYRTLTSNWTSPEEILSGREEPPTSGTGSEVPEGLSFAERMMCMDTRTYLPDNIMVKVDRATMAVSLESRAPFLDHRVVELAWRIPLSLKLRGGRGKWVLRRLLERRVPGKLIERPKMGFGVPVDSWLRGPLRRWAESLLAPERLRSEGLFDAGVVRQRWQEHQAGARNLQSPLWNLLMFQAWRAA